VAPVQENRLTPLKEGRITRTTEFFTPDVEGSEKSVLDSNCGKAKEGEWCGEPNRGKDRGLPCCKPCGPAGKKKVDALFSNSLPLDRVT